MTLVLALLMAVTALWVLLAVVAMLAPIVLHLIAYLHGRRKP